MSRRRHIPIRSCIGCGGRDRRDAMLRIVRDVGGELGIDSSRHAGGRGGYLHPSTACWSRFAQRKGSVRSFRTIVDRPTRSALIEALGRAGVERGRS